MKIAGDSTAVARLLKKTAVPHEFREGLAQMAKKLQVQVYQDDLVVCLEACGLVVEAVVTDARLLS